MGRKLVVGLAVAFAFAAPGRANADVGVYPAIKVVPAGGVIHGKGDGSGMAVYLVPAAAGPKRHACHGNGICEPTVRRAPGAPFILLGRLRRTRNTYATQTFNFTVPANLTPGLYRMYLYCPPCGGSLIQSGLREEGETIRIVARPPGRRIRIAAGARRTRFLSSEPAGVILLLRGSVARQ